MIRARQHRPTFVDSDEPLHTAEAATGEELTRASWIHEWSTDPGFYRYSVSAYLPDTFLLMAERNDGREWNVIAYLSERPADLAEWTAPKEGANQA